MDEHETDSECTDDGTTAEPRKDADERPARKPMYKRDASPAPGYSLPRLAKRGRKAFHQDAGDED